MASSSTDSRSRQGSDSAHSSGIEIHATQVGADCPPAQLGGLEKFFISFIYCYCFHDSPDSPCPCLGPVIWLKRNDILSWKFGVKQGAGGERVDRLVVAPGAMVMTGSATCEPIERVVEMGKKPGGGGQCGDRPIIHPDQIDNPQKYRAGLAKEVASHLRNAGIRVSVRSEDDALEWTNADGKQMVLSVRTGATNAAAPTVEFEGSVDGTNFKWKMSIAHDDAVAYKRFTKTANKVFRKEMKKFAADAGGDPLADHDDDNAFCFALGAGTGIANPVAGFLLGATCLWFASNGLD